MEPISIPAVSILKGEDAIALRQIVASLIGEIETLRKAVERLSNSGAPHLGAQYEKYRAGR